MKKNKLVITELFLVKPNWNRTFMGEIYRDVTYEGKPIIKGIVKIDNFIVTSSASTQKQLGNYLDDACTLILNGKLDKVVNAKVIEIVLSETIKFFTN